MRLIDKDALKGRCITYVNRYVTMMCIESEPEIDAVPVVRCKDCNFHGGNKRCVKIGLYTSGSDFCSYGERKEDG